MTSRSLIFCSLVFAASTGCKSDNHQTAPATPTSPAPTPEVDRDLEVITVSGIELDPTLAAMCGVDANRVFFKYDSATLRPEAAEALDMIATCLTSGPATGKDIRIIGRTDPRGSAEYNKELGTSRAESVASYLRAKGVGSPRVDVISKGEMDASPERDGWPYDRRVTLRLAE